jgi:hypothetical protein
MGALRTVPKAHDGPDTATASTAPAIEAAAGRRSYLREAQAYMLISMPTGTSTIFGAFQAIGVSQGY